jgi:hypothetical protein
MSGIYSMSGLSVPRKIRRKANDLIGLTHKPDKITVDKEGWNLEPSKSRFFQATALALALQCRSSVAANAM